MPGKKIWYVIFALLLASCSKDETSDSPIAYVGTLQAKFDNQLVKFNNVSAWAATTATNFYPYILVGGTEESSFMDALYIQLWGESLPAISSYSSMGDCWGDSTCLWMHYQVNYDQSDEYSIECGHDEATAGTITFSILEFQLGGKVKGTFSGTFINNETLQPIQVTEGVFDAEIIEFD